MIPALGLQPPEGLIKKIKGSRKSMRVIQHVNLSTIHMNRMLLLLPFTSFNGMLLDALAWMQSNGSVQCSIVKLMRNSFLFSIFDRA
jgi:hypothetical protein